jgi:hypothetical protein
VASISEIILFALQNCDRNGKMRFSAIGTGFPTLDKTPGSLAAQSFQAF